MRNTLINEPVTSTPTITVFMVDGGGFSKVTSALFLDPAEAAGCGKLKKVSVATRIANWPVSDFI